VPAGSLQAAGLLPAAWVDRNSYGHRHVVLIRQPTAGNLEMMVTQQGGQAVRPADLTRVAARAGAAGGFVPEQNLPSAPTTQVTGMGGGWAAPRATWTAGSWQPQPGRAATYAFFPANASENGTFLSRVNTGNPDDTRMQTSINMNGNAISGAGAVSASSVSASGDVAAGNLISYNNLWTAEWVDGGNINSRGTVNTNHLHSHNGIWANGAIDAHHLNSRADMWAHHIWSRTWMASDHGIWTNGQLLPRHTSNEGWGCWENGLISRSPTGDILTCQGGMMRRTTAQAFGQEIANYNVHRPLPWNGSGYFQVHNNTSSIVLAQLTPLSGNNPVFYVNSQGNINGGLGRVALLHPGQIINVCANFGSGFVGNCNEGSCYDSYYETCTGNNWTNVSLRR
jgi:hypothetical protein